MEPNLAWVPYETQIANILATATTPLASKEILALLQSRFKMAKVRNEHVNTVLYNLSAYEIVNQAAVDAGDEPTPLWRLRPAAAAIARKNLGLPPAPQDASPPASQGASPPAAPAISAAPAVNPPAEARSEGGPSGHGRSGGEAAAYSDLPPLEVVPDGEYAGLTAALGGPSRDPGEVWAAMESLFAKGVASLTVLVDQPAGDVAWSGDWDTWPKFGRSPASCAYPGGRRPLRLRVAETHRAVLAKSDLLCVVSENDTIADYAVRHLISTFEDAGRPVYRQPGRPPQGV